jgi:predicted phosphodiesterase
MKKFIYASDLHFPYENRDNVEEFLKGVASVKPDTIVLGGDIVDFYKISRFDKDPLNAITLQDEIEVVKDFLESLRNVSSRSKIYWLEGNHEERLTKYIRVNAPEFASLPALAFESLFNLREFNVEYVKDTKVLQIDDWVFRHGHECGNGSTPGLSARKGVMMYGANYIQGHIHKANIIRVSNFNGDFIGVESPCLSEMEPEYVKGFAGWQAGYTVGKLEDGRWKIIQEVL